MDVVCEPNPKRNLPIENRKKVKNKISHETSIAYSPRRCICCESLRCTHQPYRLFNSTVEIEPSSSDCERESISDLETVFCNQTDRAEEICSRKPSWEPCKGGVEEKLWYSENEINCFIEVIEQKLRDSLAREDEPLICRSDALASEIPGKIGICRGSSLENNVKKEFFTDDVCKGSLTCDNLDAKETHDTRNDDEDKVRLSKELDQGPVRDIYGSHKPIVSSDENKSEDVSKWGELDIVDRLLTRHKRTISRERSRLNKYDVVYETEDKFDELDGFSCFDKKCFATLRRHMFRWSYRLSKTWRAFISEPHVVIHLPSLGYTYEIRRRALKSFDFLQNIQFTRLGWLANENAQLLYIFPSNQSLEMITLFRNLIKNVRPDVTENRLLIIQPDSGECLKTKCLNGSRALYQSSKTYRRVKMLTAGRQAFVLPGVMEEIDVIIASELRVPIMGPPLEFQNHFLNKSNVANFLEKIRVDQPPYVPDVRHFSELCERLARLMIKFPKYVTWLIKINYGINGLQTASISFEKSSSREIIAAKCKKSEKELAVLLMEILPGEMVLNKKAYKSCTEFFCDLEKYGGLVQARPYVDYRILSLGVFVEHDTATPGVCASADVFHVPHDLTTDLCYGIPQATTARLPLENLVINVGIALREWQYTGYFGIDVLVLRYEDSMDKYLVVDIDPHYTDVIAFTDWVRFCLGVGSSCQSCQSKFSHGPKNANRLHMNKKIENLDLRKIFKPEDTMERYAVCSGKLYSNGLAKYCGTTLVSLCEELNVRYNFRIKQGSMICPIDSERRALGLISLHPERSRAIDEFTKGLRVLHKLSLEKHNDKIKTNMLVSYRGLFSWPAKTGSSYVI